MKMSVILLASVLPLAAGCGSNDPGNAAALDAGPAPSDVVIAVDMPAVTADTPTAADVSQPTADTPMTDTPVATMDSGARVPVLVDCAAMDYVDRTGAMDDRMIVPRGTTGYTPRCMTIRVGQSVMFSMSFTTHPLTSGVPHGSSVGATTPSPIQAQSSGTSYTVAFPNAGYYPFYCTTHAHIGMAGVVRVIP